MSRKRLTYEYIKEQFEKRNWVLVSKEYRGAHYKLYYICDKDHRGSITWGNFQKGNGCKKCYNKKISKALNFIKNQFEKEEYTLLSKKYINNKQKLDYICSKGHKGVIRWNDWQQGHRCAECLGLKRLTYEYVKEQFEKESYKLMSKKYINAYTKLEYICDKGHKGSMTWADFSQGHRCAKCFHENNRGENHYYWKNYSQEELQQLKNYRDNIVQLSNQNYRKHYYLINPFKLKRGYYNYHLDHIYSVVDGFNNNIDPKIISSPVNLRIISRFDNQNKRNKSDISLENLLLMYTQFEEFLKR